MLGNKISEDAKLAINIIKIPFASGVGAAAAAAWALHTEKLPARQFTMMTFVALIGMQYAGLACSQLLPQRTGRVCAGFTTIVAQLIAAFPLMEIVKFNVAPEISWDLDGDKGIGMDLKVMPAFLAIVLSVKGLSGYIADKISPDSPNFNTLVAMVGEVLAIYLGGLIVTQIPGAPSYEVAGEAFALAILAATLFHMFTDNSIRKSVDLIAGRSAIASRTGRASIIPTNDSYDEPGSTPLLEVGADQFASVSSIGSRTLLRAGAGAGRLSAISERSGEDMERPSLERTESGAPLDLSDFKASMAAQSSAKALPGRHVPGVALAIGRGAVNSSRERVPDGLAQLDA